MTAVPCCLEGVAVAVDTYSQSRPFRVHCGSRCVATPPPAPARRTLSHHEEIPMSSITTATGLTIEDTVIGQGAAAAAGRDVTLHYAGRAARGPQLGCCKGQHGPVDVP